MKQSPLVAVAWYRAADWPRLLAVADDRARLPTSFEEFERIASARVAALAKSGTVEKVLVDVDELVAFCRAEGPTG